MTTTPAEEDLLLPCEVAALVDTAERTLRYWRAKGKGPAYRRVVKGYRETIQYERAAVEAFIAERRSA